MSEDEQQVRSVSLLRSRFEQLASEQADSGGKEPGKSAQERAPLHSTQFVAPRPRVAPKPRIQPPASPSRPSSANGTSLVPPPVPVSRSPSPRIRPPGPTRPEENHNVAETVKKSKGQEDDKEQSPFTTPPSSEETQTIPIPKGRVASRPVSPDRSVSKSARPTSLITPSDHQRLEIPRTPSRGGRMAASAESSDTEGRPSLPPRSEGSRVRTVSSDIHDHIAKSLQGQDSFLRKPPKPTPPTSHPFPKSIPTLAHTNSTASLADSSDEDEAHSADEFISDFPDSSQVNRRRPVFTKGGTPKEIEIKHEVRKWAVSGYHLCASIIAKQANMTRVWNLKTGEVVRTLTHEATRVTALAFKPSEDLDREARFLWLGTKEGQIWEWDTSKLQIDDKKTSVHNGAVVAIHRCGADIWTLDESGKLQVWAGNGDSPSLRESPVTFRIPGKYTFSVVVKEQLWVATGKQIYVCQPTADQRSAFTVMSRPLVPNKLAGDITSGSMLHTSSDRIFFGHNDGKISIYSTTQLKCLEVVTVSNYNIIALAGVGSDLWVAFKTGMVYVYDTNLTPWKVLKDWRAHDGPVQDLVVDRASIWKIGRLQVLTIGLDNFCRIWDGMLMDDWFENRLTERDVEYCDFREMKCLVCTWNAGASKPTDLAKSSDDAAWLNQLLQKSNSPDIVVFGFQELVDLEDKRLTAKTLVKSSKKKKDASNLQEHMSHQYRIWQERLTQDLKTVFPNEPYAVIHSAHLVGLYTCIVVKTKHAASVKNVCAATVKTGLAGLHGNKGAVVIRFVLDDSSICFINCHLAAGQSGTIHRNNDLAKILQSESLSTDAGDTIQNHYFVGGGDGSMIMDHEICILNGDLNYRIDLPREVVLDRIRKSELEKLLESDQLLCQRRKNSGFRLASFQEPSITFAPTYKYNVGTDEYDSSEKKRVPAWCDRIYYRGAAKRVTAGPYQRHTVRVSDHRPVSCLFNIRVKTVNQSLKRQVWEKVAQQWLEVAQDAVHKAKVEQLVSLGFSEQQAARVLESYPKIKDAIKELRASG